MGSTSGTIIAVPIAGWTGTTSFDFKVIDPFGAESAPQTITIFIADVPEPPRGSDIVLTVYEDSCVFSNTGCVAYADWRNERFVQEFAVDNDVGDVDSLSLTFLTVPDATTLGTVGYLATSTDADLSPLTVGSAPQAKPDAPWQFFFEPLPDSHSSGCNAAGENCNVYATGTFRITDRTGLTSPTYTLTIYVIPVNDPPTCTDL
jgi:hypothetical protein